MSAKDKATNREQSIKITGTGTLDKGEVDRLVKEAEAHANEDQQIRDAAETKNQADSLAYQTERMLKEVGDKVSAEERGKVESALAELKEAVKGTDSARIKQATEALSRPATSSARRCTSGQRPARKRRPAPPAGSRAAAATM